ncbi:23S rRNA (adenine(2503)-C(2))-methyltransferase RlmN [Inmirania thermothiophila]|uniref:23S rRNA (adenine(2503)-C(2))-methyltransferase RlmN n=1 Tax=Inmirania thermothiophila TaxID=1750597 RepID=UPI001B86F959
MKTAGGGRTNLLGLDRGGLAAYFAQRGEPAFRAVQLARWVYRRGVTDFAAMTDLSKGLRARLAEEAELTLPEVLAERVSADGTRKWLLRLADGNAVETVFIPEPDRGTLCVSSQVGCVLNCSFCMTARQGFSRNLTAAEIVAQVWLAQQRLGGFAIAERSRRPITNVVLMGMGEPLLNLEAVIPALRLLVDDHGFGLSRRRVTVSTAGVVPGIRRLREAAPVSLAVSLHATTDALRDRLVPLNRKYPIRELLAACAEYVADDPRRRVTFEYVLLAGVNDAVADAEALVRLLRGIPAKVNLIPFNPFPGAPYRRPAQAAVDRFRDVLLAAGMTAITRRPRGDDIEAACGQLAGQVRSRVRRRFPEAAA